MGINYAAINYPVLAPLAPEEQPSAVRIPFADSSTVLTNLLCFPPQMAFHALTRSFGQVLGITIGSTVLQNQLSKKLPESFISQFGGTSNVAYAAIPLIKNLYVVVTSDFCSVSLTIISHCLIELNLFVRKFERLSLLPFE